MGNEASKYKGLSGTGGGVVGEVRNKNVLPIITAISEVTTRQDVSLDLWCHIIM